MNSLVYNKSHTETNFDCTTNSLQLSASERLSSIRCVSRQLHSNPLIVYRSLSARVLECANYSDCSTLQFRCGYPSSRCSVLDFRTESECCCGAGRSGAAPLWSILLSVSVAVALVAGAGYGLYQFRLRSAMHQVPSTLLDNPTCFRFNNSDMES